MATLTYGMEQDGAGVGSALSGTLNTIFNKGAQAYDAVQRSRLGIDAEVQRDTSLAYAEDRALAENHEMFQGWNAFAQMINNVVEKLSAHFDFGVVGDFIGKIADSFSQVNEEHYAPAEEDAQARQAEARAEAAQIPGQEGSSSVDAFDRNAAPSGPEETGVSTGSPASEPVIEDDLRPSDPGQLLEY